MSETEDKTIEKGDDSTRIQPGEVRLTFTRAGVTEEYLIRDHVHGTWILHREHFSYDELSDRVNLDLKLKGGCATKTSDGKAITEIQLRFQVPVSESTVVMTQSLEGSHAAIVTKALPAWGPKYVSYLNRPGTQPHAVAEIIQSHGTITKKDLRRELKARGYAGWSGQVDRTIQLLRDYLGKVTSTGRGDRTVYKWLGGEAVSGPQTAPVSGTSSPTFSTTGASTLSSPTDESYLGKRIMGFSLKEAHYDVKTAKDMLLKLSSLLINQAPSKVDGLFKLHGTRRQYFSEHPREIGGVPTRIPGTNVYAETNLNRDLIVKNCKEMLRVFEVPQSDFKVYTDETA